jgi:hypothetical protein
MLAFGFTKKRQPVQELTETLYFLAVKPIFRISYTEWIVTQVFID